MSYERRKFIMNSIASQTISSSSDFEDCIWQLNSLSKIMFTLRKAKTTCASVCCTFLNYFENDHNCDVFSTHPFIINVERKKIHKLPSKILSGVLVHECTRVKLPRIWVSFSTFDCFVAKLIMLFWVWPHNNTMILNIFV